MAEILTHPEVSIKDSLDGLSDPVPPSLVLRHKAANCRADQCRRLVKKACMVESLALDQLSMVVLVESTSAILWRAHDNVAEPYIVLCSRRAATKTDHQAGLDAGKAVKHILHHTCGEGLPVLTIGQNRDNDVVTGHRPQDMIVAVVGGNMVWSFVENRDAAILSVGIAQIQPTVYSFISGAVLVEFRERVIWWKGRENNSSLKPEPRHGLSMSNTYAQIYAAAVVKSRRTT